VASALVFFALISPWTVRNYRIFHRIIFVRDNFGAELRLGNGPDAVGLWMEWLHPTQNTLEMNKYRQLGEVPYVAERGNEATAYIAQNPIHFLQLCARRAVYFWAGLPRPVNHKKWTKWTYYLETRNSGYLALSVLAFLGLWLALRRGKDGAFLFAVLLMMYPVVYYVVFPHPRYRHPIEPEMLILAAYLISETCNFRPRTPVLSLGVPRFTKLSVIVAEPHARLGYQIAEDLALAPISLQKEVVFVSHKNASPEHLASGAPDVPDDVEIHSAHLVSRGAEQLRHALAQTSGDLIIIQNGRISSSDCGRLLEPVLTGRADVVYSAEHSTRCLTAFWSPARAITTAFNVVTNIDLRSLDSVCKVFRREELQRILSEMGNRNYESALALGAYQRGSRICEVAISSAEQPTVRREITWPQATREIASLLAHRFLL
jgi:hypothetical protein